MYLGLSPVCHMIICSTVVDLLIPTKVWDENSEVSFCTCLDETHLMFQTGHLPLLSILILDLLPLLLFFYAILKTQFCIHCLPTRFQNAPFLLDNILSWMDIMVHPTAATLLTFFPIFIQYLIFTWDENAGLF